METTRRVRRSVRERLTEQHTKLAKRVEAFCVNLNKYGLSSSATELQNAMADTLSSVEELPEDMKRVRKSNGRRNVSFNAGDIVCINSDNRDSYEGLIDLDNLRVLNVDRHNVRCRDTTGQEILVQRSCLELYERADAVDNDLIGHSMATSSVEEDVSEIPF